MNDRMNKVRYLNEALTSLSDAIKHINDFAACYNDLDTRLFIVAKSVSPLMRVSTDLENQRDFLLGVDDLSK